MSPALSTESDIKLPPIPLTTINLPIYVPEAEIDRLVNSLVQSSLQDGFTVEEDYKLIAKISGDISTRAYNQTLNFVIPIALEIYPRANWSNVKATGKLELDLDLNLDIFQNKLLVKSVIKSNRWMEKPKLSVLGIRLPVEGIANSFINKYKSELTQTLDEYFSTAADLDKLKLLIQKNFEEPFYSTEDSIINVYSSPSELALGPMYMQDMKIVFPVSLFLENVVCTTKPAEIYNDLSFSIRPQIEPETKFALQARIPLNYLELNVKESMENQTFGSGISKINIQKIGLSGVEKVITVQIQLTGAYKGQIQVQFEPVFNDELSKIQLTNFKMKAVEGKSLDKVLFALVKGIAENRVKKEIEDGLNNLLNEYQQTLLPYLDSKEIYPGIILSGSLQKWNIQNIRCINSVMTFSVHTQLMAALKILSFDPKLFVK